MTNEFQNYLTFENIYLWSNFGILPFWLMLILIPNSNLCIGGLPTEIEENAGIIFYIDQITTAKNLLKDLSNLKDRKINSRRIRVITALAANQGLKEIGENIQDLNIYCACIDPELISESELSPGIGDPSLRIKTRVTSSF